MQQDDDWWQGRALPHEKYKKGARRFKKKTIKSKETGKRISGSGASAGLISPGKISQGSSAIS